MDQDEELSRSAGPWIELRQGSEFERLAALERDVYPEDDCISAADYLQYLASGNRVFVLTDGSDWIGNYQIGPVPDDAPIIEGVYVSGVAVFQSYQRRGLAAEVMDELLTQHGHRTLCARVRTDNDRIKRVISGRGFVKVGSQVRNAVVWDWYVRQGVQRTLPANASLPDRSRAEPSQTCQLRDGRLLGWSVFGAPQGRPVLAFHGTPACRLLFRPAHAPAERLGLRLIAPDRPGYGLSDPAPGRTLTSWADDVAQLMDRLEISRAPILAISGGGPYAVACAARLGARISGLALVSPLGEVAVSRAPMAPGHRSLYRGLLRRPRLLRWMAQGGRRALLAMPDAFFASTRFSLSAADRRALAAPGAKAAVNDAALEGLRRGVDGLVSDATIFGRPWGLDLTSIRCPSVLWQGTADRVVPAAVTLELGARLPACDVRRLEGAGHFWVFAGMEDVLQAVATLPP